MSGNRCPTREADALAFLEANGPSSQSEVAAYLGIKANTASNYLQALRKDGKAWPSGIGCRAVWTAGKPPGPATSAESAVRQASSVWDYAQRMT